MAKLENRFIRIEDWKGNIYYPDSNADTSTAGTISGEASTDTGADPYTEGTYVADSSANGGKSLMVTSTSERKVLYLASFSSISFGNISVGIRAKTNIATGNVNCLEMKSYFRDSSGETPVDTLLDTYDIAGKNFGVADTFITLYHTVEYKGTATGDVALVIELDVLPDTGASIWFDQMFVALDTGSSASGGVSDIYVQGSTIVVDK